jgi:FAD/FMN-containing dehydrogenase
MPPSPDMLGTYRTDLRARAAYAEGAGIYRIVPAAIARPVDVDDLVRLVRWAAAGRRPLVPRGAGSAMGGGNVGDGVIVDLTGLAQAPVSVRAAQLIAHAGASVTCAELNRAAAAHALRLPPDPSSGKWATLGGMLSTNAAGARSVRYGSVRRWVHAAEVVTADGQVARVERGRAAPAGIAAFDRFAADAAPAIRAAADLIAARFPRTRKNSSGYALDAWLASGDLLDLLIGAEGTLALVTAADWRLDRHPPASAALRISLASLDSLGDVVETLLAHDPAAVELLDRTFLDLIGTHGAPARSVREIEAVLLVEIEGRDVDSVAAAAREAADAVRPMALRVETAVEDADMRRLWAIRHAASPILAGLPEERRSLQVIEDGCVPVRRLGEYVRAVRDAAARRQLDVVLFGHAGDGHLHCNLLPQIGRVGWEEDVASLLEEVTDVVAALGGTPSGEHGDGRLRAPLLERIFGAEIMALFALVKVAFDPHGILNPGIKLGHAPPITRLKAGSGAASLPDDIAGGLRAIEREGGYATPRLALLD